MPLPEVVWLHPVHVQSQENSAGSSEIFLPWSSNDPPSSSSRLADLQNLLASAEAGQKLCTLPLSKVKADGQVGQSVACVRRPGQKLSLTRNDVVISDKAISTEVKIPLMLSDVVHIKVKTGKEKKDPDRLQYLIAIAPRAKDGQEHDQKEPVLGDVWLLCIGASSTADVLQLLFEFGHRGGLRWDLDDFFNLSKEPLGTGGCGKVYLGVRKKSQSKPAIQSPCETSLEEEVAIKILRKSVMTKDLDSVKTELEMLRQLQGHPNTTRLFGVFSLTGSAPDDSDDEDEGHKKLIERWAIVTELCKDGDFFEFLATYGALPVDACFEFACGILSALVFLHHLRVVHRDVKAENILLGEMARPILADYGMCASLDDERAMKQIVGSPGYAAPELVMGRQYNEKVDVFSLGVVLYFALSNKLPFAASDAQKVLRLTVQCKIKFSQQDFGSVRGSMMSLLKAFLAKEPELRPSAKKAFMASWAAAPEGLRGLQNMQAAYKALPEILGQQQPQQQQRQQQQSNQGAKPKVQPQQAQPEPSGQKASSNVTAEQDCVEQARTVQPPTLPPPRDIDVVENGHMVTQNSSICILPPNTSPSTLTLPPVPTSKSAFTGHAAASTLMQDKAGGSKSSKSEQQPPRTASMSSRFFKMVNRAVSSLRRDVDPSTASMANRSQGSSLLIIDESAKKETAKEADKDMSMSGSIMSVVPATANTGTPASSSSGRMRNLAPLKPTIATEGGQVVKPSPPQVPRTNAAPRPRKASAQKGQSS